jgi:pimeloyl-ACP methyl ester carboxylesterase
LAALEPRIRYANASDGKAIAYWTLGEGIPLVHMGWLPWSHIEIEWRNPAMRTWYERLAAFTNLIRYDTRGFGLSDAAGSDYSIEAQVKDLEAVVDRLELKRFAMFAVLHTGPAAFAYASRHPDRVSHIMLWGTYARGQDYYQSPQVRAIRTLIGDWALYTETAAHSFVGWDSGDVAHAMALMMRDAVSPEAAIPFYETMRNIDCTPLLAKLVAPTLVIQPLQFPLLSVELAQQMAASIPDARLVLVDGASLAPSRCDVDAVCRSMQEFLAEDPAPSGQRVRYLSGQADGTPELSAREKEVLALLAQGQSNRDIAEQLVLSVRTVERHIENIYAKIRVNGRAQATVYALRHDLL